MRPSLYILPIISGLFFLAACDSPKSTQWYKSHQDELSTKYKECELSGEDSQDCKNAREARFELSQASAPVPDLN
ncbi:EexN family lipoprotein [Kosakonia sacchari]|uniref:Eex protein n=1 Tax=Kosakonia sacchari TaxID=1158459 RepID=A0A1G4YSZ8_9ENTR|nr:EexN family lipoprotein [Kosakonia sacchari]SCX56573.1 hypothetical protein SAMN02927897_03320 [Kosakonia sacchari]